MVPFGLKVVQFSLNAGIHFRCRVRKRAGSFTPNIFRRCLLGGHRILFVSDRKSTWAILDTLRSSSTGTNHMWVETVLALAFRLCDL